MNCARCETDAPSDADFCPQCGAKLIVACAQCGTANAPQHGFCKKCGQSLARLDGAASGAMTKLAFTTYTPTHLAERILTSKAALEGERKQVTVLFADMKSSSELLADLDPEEARTILDPVLERMMQAVHMYGGTVNQVLGDGVMALFGAPQAHEDHALRACHAALRMQELVNRYDEDTRRSHNVPIRIRIGLNSGEVIVRALESDLHPEYSAVGQTTHLAARMEQLANPGSIFLTASTLAFVEDYVSVKPLGSVPVKGFRDAVTVYELVGASLPRTQRHAAGLRGLTRFVGREGELAHLQRTWRLARSGRGQVTAIVGEAGIGKSRLVREITRSAWMEGGLILESGSVSYGTAMSYLPVIDLLNNYFNIQAQDDVRQITEKVSGTVRRLDEGLAPVLPALRALLDVPVDDGSWRALDPGSRRQSTLDAVRQLLLREAQRQPLLVVFEDLQWIDSETQALLDGLVQTLESSRLLLLVSYRPDYRHTWGSKGGYSQVRLDALSTKDTADLLNALLGREPGLGPLKDVLVEIGNPFFLEEIVRSLVETSTLVGEPGRYRLTKPIPAIQVPPTVQAVLAARIDLLPAAEKRLLQIASVVGAEVPLAVLRAVASLSEDTLGRALDTLQASEFLGESGSAPEVHYSFKHTLTHDVAYGSLLRERRRDLHARIMRAMERLYPDPSPSQLERLVHHARRGEVWDKALTYARDASTRALDRSAVAQALAHAEHALEALTHVEVGPERKRLELVLVTQRATALRALHGYAAPEVESVYREADALCTEGVDLPERFGLEWQEMQFFLVRADLAKAQQLASSLLAHAEARQDRTLLIDAHLAGGMAAFPLGAFATARDHFQRSVALCGSQTDGPNLLTHGQCPHVFSLGYLAWTLWFLGYPEGAQRCVERAVEVSRRQAHPFTLVSALTFAARVYHGRRELERVRALAEEIVALARDQGFAYYEAQGLVSEGWACAMSKGEEWGYAQLQKGCAALEKTGTVLARRGALVQTVEVCQRLGRLDEASDILTRMQAETEGSRVLCWDAEIARLKAEIATGGPASAAARQWYRTALATARAQDARALELRAAVSYACAQHGAEFDSEARTMLAEVVGRFDEPVESPELREARALLRA